MFGGVCSRSDVERIVADYPSRSAISVHYDPGNPAESVVLPGKVAPNTQGAVWGMSFLLALTSALCALIIMSRRYALKISSAQKAYAEAKLARQHETTPRNYVLEKLAEQVRDTQDPKN